MTTPTTPARVEGTLDPLLAVFQCPCGKRYQADKNTHSIVKCTCGQEARIAYDVRDTLRKLRTIRKANAAVRREMPAAEGDAKHE